MKIPADELRHLGLGLRRSAGRSALGQTIYPDPDLYGSAEELVRAEQADIPYLEIGELQRELGCARLRLLLDDSPSEWVRARVAELEAEIAKRRGRR